jgi:hypothetical protein
LLTDPGFILEPDLDCRMCGTAEKRVLHQANEVS